MNDECKIWKIGDFEFDVQLQRIRGGGKERCLGPIKVRLLKLLVKNSFIPVDPKDFLDIWNTDNAAENLHKAIQYLRDIFSPVERESYIARNPYRLIPTPECIASNQVMGPRVVNSNGEAVFPEHDGIGLRLTAVVDEVGRKSPFYVAIGEGDFFRSWLSRILQNQRLSAKLSISKIVILGLSSSAARRFEQQGRLRPRFTNAMLENIYAIQNDPELAKRHIVVELRTWKGYPQFHGYLYRHNILVAPWQTDDHGCLNVRTALTAKTRKMNPAEYAAILRTFKSSLPQKLRQR
jgi:hypothetical protein